MDDEENGIIRLVSKDGDVFELSERAANLSELIQDSPREEDEEVTKLDRKIFTTSEESHVQRGWGRGAVEVEVAQEDPQTCKAHVIVALAHCQER